MKALWIAVRDLERWLKAKFNALMIKIHQTRQQINNKEQMKNKDYEVVNEM